MNHSSQRGVALVITLIMLSVVTFMAVAFLSLSRRERASVSVTSDQLTASQMADAALAHAQSKLVVRLMARTNMTTYEFMVSTNYLPFGYDPALGFSPANANYQYRRNPGNLTPLTSAERNQAIRSLQYDPRPPVYFDTNVTETSLTVAAPPLDFRFFWDFNRNGLFETNGYLPVLGPNGQPVVLNNQVLTNFFVGDPEFIGVLEKPNQPHSANNKFIGRFAYIVLPAGKSLDLNYIHNMAKNIRGKRGQGVEGYFRNEGVGAWELNLAAFFVGLNTNEWPAASYLYDPSVNASSGGKPFADALGVLRARQYGPITSLSNIATIFGAYGANYAANAMRALSFTNGIDYYTVGRRMSGIWPPVPYSVPVASPWPGSDSPQPYADVQELFSLQTPAAGFPARVQGTEPAVLSGRPATSLSSYDRYTFYRLLGQMGVDSAPEPAPRLHLNYATDPQGNITFTNWTPLGFFTNAADLLLRSQGNYLNTLSALFNATNRNPISVTNIPLYPVNFYTPAVHRLLQVAANIYDATTNNYLLRDLNGRPVDTGYPYLPSVFRPVFRNLSNVVSVAGYVEVTNDLSFLDSPNYPWLDLSVPADRNRISANISSNVNVYGVPLVIGAKKGLPNFNECAVQTAVQVSRKLEIRKAARSLLPNQTNQLYMIGISNAFGVEAWNSYSTAYPRPLQMRVYNQFRIGLTNLGNTVPLAGYASVSQVITNFAANSWTSNRFVVPLNTNIVFLTNAAYLAGPPARLVVYSTNLLFEPARGFPIPQWGLAVTNRLQFALIDRTANRIVDFVNLDKLGTQIDISAATVGSQNFREPSNVGAFWSTNRLTAGGVPDGVRQQILESLGQLGNNSDWVNFSADPVQGQSKDKAIDLFRVFLGLAPLKFPRVEMQQELGNSVTHQAPFTPTRKIYQNTSYQANDPLVHYLVEDLLDLVQTNNIQYAVPPSQVPTNSNLGLLNRRWAPWGGNPNVSSAAANDYNLAIKDPMVRTSDDWNFPTNKFPNLGWIGRVHRGTPWQTIYLKSTMAEPARWVNWSGNFFTHPTNDWRMVGLFTTSLTPGSARGLLSVNQTNLAAWSAVLGSVSVLSNAVAAPNLGANYAELLVRPDSPQLHYIVDGINATRAARPGGTFQYLGEVLATPALTTNSPYLNLAPSQSVNIPDEVYERIPQQILSLLKADDPWVVVYAYGQALAPSGPPVLAPGTLYDRMYTNYHVTAEVLTKHLLRVYNSSPNPNLIAPMAVRQRFQYLPNE